MSERGQHIERALALDRRRMRAYRPTLEVPKVIEMTKAGSLRVIVPARRS